MKNMKRFERNAVSYFRNQADRLTKKLTRISENYPELAEDIHEVINFIAGAKSISSCVSEELNAIDSQ